MSSDFLAACRSDIESFIVDWMSDNHIPGAAIAVVDGDGRRYAEGFGARSLPDEPATPDTLFGFGSCSKSVTALAVTQLAERDALSLTDSVNEYLPHLSDAPGDPITVRELLTHTSGLPSDELAGPLVARPLLGGHVEVPMASDDDFRRHVEDACERRVTDREAFMYSNTGYTLLGIIVEAVTGKSYAEYVRENVFDPLGMDRSTYSREEFEADSDRMTPYVRQETETVAKEFPFDDLLNPSGGLLTSVAEFTNYLRLHVDGGTVGGETVLSTAGVEEMSTPIASFGTRFDGVEVGYGYGVMIEPFLGETLVEHGGTMGVSNAWFGVLEESDVGVVVACTTEPETDAATAGKGVLALIRGEQPEEVVPRLRLAETLERVSGHYETYRGLGDALVERVGGVLRIELGSRGGSRELFATPDRLRDDLLVCSTVTASGMRRQVRFECDGDIDLFFERLRFSKDS